MLSIRTTRYRLSPILASTACATILVAASSAIAGPYSTAVLADNPVAYYRLGETSGNTAVNSSTAGAALNGSYVNFGAAQILPNTPSTINEAGPRPGDLSGSFAIQGLEPDNIGIRSGANANAQVEVTDNALLDLTGAMTLEAWVYRDPQAVNGNNEGIVGKFNGTGNQRSYCLYYNSRATGAGALSIGFILNTTGASGGNVDFPTGVDLPFGSTAGWIHLAAVYEPTVRMSVYMNGVSIGDKTTGLPAASVFNSSTPLWIGRQFSQAANTSFEGKVDEVALYNVALTPAQIQSHYLAGVPEPSTIVLAALGVCGFGLTRVIQTRRKTVS